MAAEMLFALNGRVASTHRSVGSAVKALFDKGAPVGRSISDLQMAVERDGVVHVELTSGGQTLPACIAHARLANRLGLRR